MGHVAWNKHDDDGDSNNAVNTITITITMRVFSAPYTQNRTGRHYNSQSFNDV